MALPATDDFNRSNNTDLGTNWDVADGTGCQVYSNACAANGTDVAEVWNADSFNDDQYAEGTLVAVGGNGIGVTARTDPTPDDYYYYWCASSVGRYFGKCINGSWNTFSSAGAPNVNDVFRIECEGTTITPLINDAEDTGTGAEVDSAISSGSGGVCGWGTGASSQVDDWEAGNLAAGDLTVSVADTPGVSDSAAELLPWLVKLVAESITAGDVPTVQVESVAGETLTIAVIPSNSTYLIKGVKVVG